MASPVPTEKPPSIFGVYFFGILMALFGGRIVETLSKGYQSTEEYKIISEAFARAESVTIEGNELVMSLR